MKFLVDGLARRPRPRPRSFPLKKPWAILGFCEAERAEGTVRAASTADSQTFSNSRFSLSARHASMHTQIQSTHNDGAKRIRWLFGSRKVRSQPQTHNSGHEEIHCHFRCTLRQSTRHEITSTVRECCSSQRRLLLSARRDADTVNKIQRLLYQHHKTSKTGRHTSRTRFRKSREVGDRVLCVSQ